MSFSVSGFPDNWGITTGGMSMSLNDLHRFMAQLELFAWEGMVFYFLLREYIQNHKK
jgi:hypothetical protein